MNLLILGAGGHSRVLMEAAQASGGWERFAFLDDAVGVEQVAGWPVLGKLAECERLREQYDQAIVGIGNNAVRLAWTETLQRIGYALPAIVHPSAVISPSAVIGAGSVVFAQAAINAGTHIGEAVIINTAASVDHDCIIENGVHVAPGSHLAGGVTIRKKAWIGLGACVNIGMEVGAAAIVGAGAVVLSTVAAETTVVGIPARPIKRKK